MAVIDLTKGLMGFCLALAIGWLAFVSFALERGPDLYTIFSTIAAALALFIWAPTLFFVGLLTGEEREATGRARGGRSVRSVVAGLAIVALISLTAYALLRGGGASDESAKAGDATSAATVTSTPRPCDDETATATLRASVVRISTDSGAVGTGIIVGDNRVLTNAHVVEGASTVRVESRSGANDGTVIGADAVIDLALVQVATRGLPVVTWAVTAQLRAGQRLLALGYAFDLPGEPSTTAGIFSALRTIEGIDYVQTDTPINPGNSGGPLFTQCGHVAGLNTFRLVDQELNLQGLGFAIGSSVLERAVMDLDSGVSVTRPLPTLTPQPPVQAPAPTIAAASAEPTTAAPPPAYVPPPPCTPVNSPWPCTSTEAPAPIPPPPPSVALPPAVVCGEGISASVSGDSPIGRTYHDGEPPPAIQIHYTAPGCDSVGAYFTGTYAKGTPWWQFRCGSTVEGACRDFTLPGEPEVRLVDVFISQDQSVGRESGDLSFVGFPPHYEQGADSRFGGPQPSQIEGFTVCSVEVLFLGAVFHDSGLEFGTPCLGFSGGSKY